MFNWISLSTWLQTLISNSALIFYLFSPDSSRPACLLRIVAFFSLLFIRWQSGTVVGRIVFIYPLVSIQMRISPFHRMHAASFHWMRITCMSIVWRWLVVLLIEGQVILTFDMFCIQSAISWEGDTLYFSLDVWDDELVFLSLLSQGIDFYF